MYPRDFKTFHFFMFRRYSSLFLSIAGRSFFGGCTVSLVKEDNVQKFIEKLAPVYHDKIGLNAEFYVADIGDGVRKIY